MVSSRLQSLCWLRAPHRLAGPDGGEDQRL